MAASGCGGGDKLSFTQKRPDGVPTAVTVDGATTFSLERLVTKKVAACMTGKGWRYAVTSGPEDADLVIPAYGLDDVDFRKRFGARALPGPDGEPVRLANDDSPSGGSAGAADAASADAPGKTPQSAAEKAAFNQDLTGGKQIGYTLPQGGEGSAIAGGCVGDAQRAVYGDDLKTWFTATAVVDNLETLVQQAVARDADFRRRLAAWRSCMTERGLETDPRQRSAAGMDFPTDAWAVADAECGKAQELQKTGEHLAIAARQRVEERFSSSVLAYNELSAAAKERASRE